MKSKIFIDIYHTPQFNLFKNVIIKLGPDVVELGCVNRGRLASIIRHECPDHTLHVLADYKSNKGRLSLIFKIILPRIVGLIRLFHEKKYAVVGTASYQSNLVAKILGIPNFAILDDPRKFLVFLLRLSTREFYLPDFKNEYSGTKQFNGLKEWSYLSPKYFKPNIKVLSDYNLKRYEFIFAREVVTNTSNYIGQERFLIQKMANFINPNLKVVLSLEDKSNSINYPKEWLILQEPVKDIHSLMYYSKYVVSSGDSMAREGGLLGVSSAYIGFRDMPANRLLIDKGVLIASSPKEVADIINTQFEKDTVSLFDQDKFRENLDREWVDMTDLILSIINKLKK